VLQRFAELSDGFSHGSCVVEFIPLVELRSGEAEAVERFERRKVAQVHADR
jgi:hypothetical protein